MKNERTIIIQQDSNLPKKIKEQFFINETKVFFKFNLKIL